jgi:hypothetical protein
MSVRLGAAIILFFLAMISLLITNVLIVRIISDINRVRSDRSLFSYVGFTLPKAREMVAEYRSLYPNGKKHIYALVTLAIVVASMIGVTACLVIAR